MQKWQTAGRQQGQFNLNFMRRKSKLRQTGKCVCEYVKDTLYLDGALGNVLVEPTAEVVVVAQEV